MFTTCDRYVFNYKQSQPHPQRQNKAKNISLHRISSFPDKKKRKQWINAIKRKEPWTPTQSSRVCSLHFLQGKMFLIDLMCFYLLMML
jgi:hypothetical protein